MAILSLVLTLAFLTIVFPLRSLLRRRRFGSAGRAIYDLRRPGHWWLADLLFLAGFALVLAGPALEIVGAVNPVFEPGPALVGVAVAVALAATLLAVLSQEAMGEAWRPDIAPGEETGLVTSGPFRLVRNPNYLAMLAVAAGGTLITPTIIGFAGSLVLLAGLWLTIRAEEPLLIDSYGKDYLDYGARTGRLLPGIGLFGRADRESSSD